MRRVVVTGIGIVSPNGIGRQSFSEAIVEGRSGVGLIESFDTSGQSIKIAGEVKGFDVTPYLGGVHRKNLKVMSRAVQFAVGGWSPGDRGLRSRRPPGSTLSVSGSAWGPGSRRWTWPKLVGPISKGIGSDGSFDVGKFAAAQSESIFPLWLLKHLPNMAAAHLSILHHAMGPTTRSSPPARRELRLSAKRFG